MPDGVVSPRPWRRLPAALAPALRGRLSAVVDALAGEVAGSVYTGIDDPKTVQDIRRGVTVAVERFVDLVGTTEAALTPAVRETLEPHSGHVVGNRKGTSFPVRLVNTTSTTAGMTSPAFSMVTVSPTRMSFWRM